MEWDASNSASNGASNGVIPASNIKVIASNKADDASNGIKHQRWNKDAYNAYQREYMRKRRDAEKAKRA